MTAPLPAPVVLLAGGVGGARMAEGLAAALPEGALTCVVNTGDDLDHWGLRVCPDLDTVMYTLAGLAHAGRGWGLAGETFEALAMMRRYGGPSWFALGDRDLATHLTRTEALRRGETLSAVTERLRRALGAPCRLLPMSDAPRPTAVETADGRTLPFQRWLVAEGAPPVARVHLPPPPPPAPGVLPAIAGAALVVIAPSNPFVSIDPILTLPGVREALAARPVVAVSPLVGGRAVKGPLAEMLPRLAGGARGTAAIAAHYGGLLGGLVVHRGDEAGAGALPLLATDTLMPDGAARLRLAREVLAFAAGLPPRRQPLRRTAATP